MVAHWSHNPAVVGPSPTPTTNKLGNDISVDLRFFSGTGYLYKSDDAHPRLQLGNTPSSERLLTAETINFLYHQQFVRRSPHIRWIFRLPTFDSGDTVLGWLRVPGERGPSLHLGVPLATP